MDVGNNSVFRRSVLDADVVLDADAIHGLADSLLDAHSNLVVDANLVVVDFLVVDHDVHRFFICCCRGCCL